MMMARVSGGRKRARTESARARVRTGSAAHLLSRGRGDCDGSDRLVKHRIPRTIAAVGTGETRRAQRIVGVSDQLSEKVSSNFQLRKPRGDSTKGPVHVLAESDNLARFQIVPVQSAFVRVCWVWMVHGCEVRLCYPCARVRPCVSRLPPVQRK
jgi:hypothetical protein